MIFILRVCKRVTNKLDRTMIHRSFIFLGGFWGLRITINKKIEADSEPIKEYDFVFPKNGVYFERYKDRKDFDSWDIMAEKITEAVD